MLYYICSHRFPLIFLVVPILSTFAVQTEANAQSILNGAAAEKSVNDHTRKFTDSAVAGPAAGIKPEDAKVSEGLSGRKKTAWLNNTGVRYASTSEWENALSALQEATAADPSVPEPYINLSIVLEKLKRFDESIKAARKAVDLAPNEMRGWDQLCDLYLFSRSFEPGAKCYENMRRLGSKDEMLDLKHGLALLNNNELDKALPYLTKAVTEFPDSVAGWNSLGMIYYKKKKYKDSAEMFQKAVEISPDYAQLRYNLAFAQLGNRNRASAISQYNLIKERDPALARDLYRVLYKDKILFVDAK
jgi:tetratricopeptide (TPR) repeat protein